jgi:hypothetical protein
MWFIAGLMLGSAMSPNGEAPRPPISLGEIPFRCFITLDDSDQAYRECRRLSMTLQLAQQIANTNDEATGYKRGTLRTVVDDAISLELRALRKLEASSRPVKTDR